MFSAGGRGPLACAILRWNMTLSEYAADAQAGRLHTSINVAHQDTPPRGSLLRRGGVAARTWRRVERWDVDAPSPQRAGRAATSVVIVGRCGRGGRGYVAV